MPFEIGQIASDYEILGVLGTGGMGRVYRVRHLITNRVEAMKVLLSDLASEAELGERFNAEIKTLARLDHPNIARLYNAFTIENQLVMVMELVEGVSLAERAKEGPIPVKEVLGYVSQTLAALSYAHEKEIIHRDIKPSNIMVTPHGLVKLMDFGIAKSSAEPLLTRPGTTVGSMLYMSPEQVRGATVDARSDLYSVGVLLYELTAGRRPFEAENTYAILEAQLNAVPKPPVEVNPALPPGLNDIIMTALSKEPGRRFQSAEAFRKALETVRAQAYPGNLIPTQPVVPPPAPAPFPGGQPGPARNRGLWMALGAVACVCVLIAAALIVPRFWRSSADSSPAQQVATRPAPAPAAEPRHAQPPQSTVTPQNQPDNANPRTVSTASPEKLVSPGTSPNPQPRRASRQEPATPVQPVQDTSGVNPASPAEAASPQKVAPQAAGPTQEQLEQANDSLVKLHARADTVRASVEHLRQEQAASGLGLAHEIAASASRLDSYLQIADRAVQNSDLRSAHKYMDNVEKELTYLEEKFGK